MKKILILSDTHGHWPGALNAQAGWADELWHAGDFGPGVAEVLGGFGRPVRGVYGNIDDARLRADFPKTLLFDCEGLSVGMVHIGGTPGRYRPDAQAIFKQKIPQLLVCGHSHILRVERDPSKNGMLFINPGAAGKEGFHKVMTALRLRLEAGRVLDMAVVELGLRGALPPA